MSKKIEKTAGRPPANIDEYFAKILPYLQLGLSINKSCDQAEVPHRTVYDYYARDEDFRRKIDKARNDLVTRSRRALAEEVETKGWKETDAHKYVLDNFDEETIKNKSQVNIAGQEVNVTFNFTKEQIERLIDGTIVE